MKNILSTLLTTLVLVAPTQPAKATDWATTGVSIRTGETVALDRDSIVWNSYYDVRFRYLIGKDLVHASANCDSSKITPEAGKPFIPDLQGATRTMLNLVCRRNDSSVSVAPRPPSQPRFTHTRLYVSNDAITSVRRMSYTNMVRYFVKEQLISDTLQNVCIQRSRGLSWETIRSIQRDTMRTMEPSLHPVLEDFWGSIYAVAQNQVCPD